ncbi:aldo/keto reductase [Aestuariivirga sp.]|jgi:aryl-alcohol dehydrogenase-like predicted oxidoreductase|uniref:aldo/keto reductase n=1 Tax=Aestuariivirga sp. TaxID=2650926 RepID=UPI003783B283
MTERLALGTVQFGMDYGVAGSGQVPRSEVARILSLARAASINTIDTAEAYGSAESVLGQVGISGFNVVGKVGRLEHIEELSCRINASAARLGIECFEAILLHAPAQIHEEPRLASALASIKGNGLTRAIGFSVYEPDELRALLGRMTPDIVQIPLSALDARWNDMLLQLASDGVRVHARSVYLQGLLTLNETPRWASRWGGLLSDWRAWVAAQETTLAQAALALAMARPVERVVIGVDNAVQLAEILDVPKLPPLPNHLTTTDTRLLDPRCWPKS